MAVHRTAGLKFKWPFQSITRLDKRFNIYNPRPSEYLTRDKKNLLIENYVLWKVEDPLLFLRTVGDPAGAEVRLHDIVWSAVSAAVGQTELSELVSTNPKEVRIDFLMRKITDQSAQLALERYGVAIATVDIKRINLPAQNRESVFARMRAERDRIARRYRAEGEEAGRKIRAEADRTAEEILAEAYRKSEIIRGQADAEATQIYGQAFSRDPKFYQLLRTLETYRRVLDDKTTAVLSGDSELFKLLTRGRNGELLR